LLSTVVVFLIRQKAGGILRGISWLPDVCRSIQQLSATIRRYPAPKHICLSGPVRLGHHWGCTLLSCQTTQNAGKSPLATTFVQRQERRAVVIVRSLAGKPPRRDTLVYLHPITCPPDTATGERCFCVLSPFLYQFLEANRALQEYRR